MIKKREYLLRWLIPKHLNWSHGGGGLPLLPFPSRHGADQRSAGEYIEWLELFLERADVQFLCPRGAVLVVQGKERIGYGAYSKRTILAF